MNRRVYMIGESALAILIESSLHEIFENDGRLVSVDTILNRLGLCVTDSHDSHIVSNALQRLRKRKLIRYRRSYRKWEILRLP